MEQEITRAHPSARLEEAVKTKPTHTMRTLSTSVEKELKDLRQRSNMLSIYFN
jgi:hypothetical protein